MRTPDDWRSLLARWSALALTDEDVIMNLPEQTIGAGWLGYGPAAGESIPQAERRLGVSLPPTYSTFLRATNGWQSAGPFIARIRPVEEIDWFAAQNREWAEVELEARSDLARMPDDEYLVYGVAQQPAHIRPEYLLTALQISDVTESAVLLLNPEIQTADGEWEAWFFASWKPGANRYRCFWDLMAGELEIYEALRSGQGADP